MAITHPLDGISDQLQKALTSIGRLQVPQRGTQAGVLDFAGADLWFPDINILETESSYIVSVNTPGINPESIFITARKGCLTIRMINHGRFTLRDLSRKIDGEKSGESARHYGEFRRCLDLPDNVLPDHVTVDRSDGLLKIILPKSSG